MPLVCRDGTKFVGVAIDGRKFNVRLDGDNQPVRISERKATERFGVKLFFNSPYWSAEHHSIGKGDTIVKRIIAAALKCVNATP